MVYLMVCNPLQTNYSSKLVVKNPALSLEFYNVGTERIDVVFHIYVPHLQTSIGKKWV